MIFVQSTEDKGFILVEALISFGLISALLIGILPFFTGLFHIRDVSKAEVELSRTMYEEALFWSRQEVESEWLSGQDLLQVQTGRFSILIAGEDGYEKKVEIESVSWQE